MTILNLFGAPDTTMDPTPNYRFMKHSEKIQRMFGDLSNRGIDPRTFAPPIYRWLWKLGVEIPPPHFSTFWFLFAFQGGCFGLALGVPIFASGMFFSLPLQLLVILSVASGVLFGLCMAIYFRWQAKTHRLPLWKDYKGA